MRPCAAGWLDAPVTASRPYPNVRLREDKSARRWEARLPKAGGHEHLGTFDTAEEARCAVLIAQAKRLEARAAQYRAEAAALTRVR